MNKKHRRGYYVLAHALYGPPEAYLCAPCIKKHPDEDDIVSVEPVREEGLYCDFCDCKLLPRRTESDGI